MTLAGKSVMHTISPRTLLILVFLLGTEASASCPPETAELEKEGLPSCLRRLNSTEKQKIGEMMQRRMAAIPGWIAPMLDRLHANDNIWRIDPQSPTAKYSFGGMAISFSPENITFARTGTLPPYGQLFFFWSGPELDKYLEKMPTDPDWASSKAAELIVHETAHVLLAASDQFRVLSAWRTVESYPGSTDRQPSDCTKKVTTATQEAIAIASESLSNYPAGTTGVEYSLPFHAIGALLEHPYDGEPRARFVEPGTGRPSKATVNDALFKWLTKSLMKHCKGNGWGCAKSLCEEFDLPSNGYPGTLCGKQSHGADLDGKYPGRCLSPSAGSP
jgi:hypothetical protein